MLLDELLKACLEGEERVAEVDVSSRSRRREVERKRQRRRRDERLTSASLKPASNPSIGLRSLSFPPAATRGTSSFPLLTTSSPPSTCSRICTRRKTTRKGQLRFRLLEHRALIRSEKVRREDSRRQGRWSWPSKAGRKEVELELEVRNPKRTLESPR